MENLYTIEEVFSGRLFQIPDYQRGYAWEKQQWRDFLDDLLTVLQLLPRHHQAPTMPPKPPYHYNKHWLSYSP